MTVSSPNTPQHDGQLTASPETAHSSPGGGYFAALGFATFGLYLALLTPVFVSMAFKLQHITSTPGDAVAALGLVTGIGSLFAMFANPLVGRLSDRTTSRWGRRRPWIVGGAAVGVLASLLIGIASDVWVVLIGWCLTQAAVNGALAALNATVPDQVPTARRGLASGIIGVMTSAAILGGSFIVNFLADDVSRFAAPALVGLVAAVVFALRLDDRKVASAPAERYGVREFLGSFVFNPRKHPDFAFAWLTTFLVMFGYAGVATFLPLYLSDRFSMEEQEAIGIVLLCNFASTAATAVSGALAGIASDRTGRRRVFVTLAGLVMAGGLVLMATATTVTIVVVGQGLIGLGAGAFLAVSLALATQVLPNPEDTAKDLGVLNIANALPQAVAPAVAPAIIAFGAMTPLGGYSVFYLVGAVVVIAGAAVVYLIKGVR
ncbi:MFS transporter [Pseudoclavibacter sp. RFBG4]|uniref:MFS transporter n=1 Tax=Pseudoclavibacter sp. RFBG4 TaxID=2080575 RepID=UPI000CE84121|nr:MFS transporter [Pseudoclavibacter sp. RFBG4]PPG28610.1 MFS transporter [Pseudoclavibacter sp. RFBG4]